jgi:hypothetical protein
VSKSNHPIQNPLLLVTGHKSVIIIMSSGENTDRIENTAPNISSIVACVFVAAGTCLPSLVTLGEATDSEVMSQSSF